MNRGITLLALAVTTCAASFAQITLPSGTKITCRLEQTLSSSTAEQGQPVQLSVTDAVKVDGVVVIPQGATVQGTVVLAQEKRSMGRTGKLDFSVDKVRALDGEYIPLRYTMHKKEGGSKGTSTGIITAGVAIVFWPAAPFVLLRKGKDVTLNRGMTFEVFTDQDHAVRNAHISAAPGSMPNMIPPTPSMQPAQPNLQYAAVAAPAPAAPVVQGALATINVTSDLQGAEVEVDGSFVGSTPASVKLGPGMHRITVKHGAAAWARDLNVQPGASVNVNAILKK